MHFTVKAFGNKFETLLLRYRRRFNRDITVKRKRNPRELSEPVTTSYFVCYSLKKKNPTETKLHRLNKIFVNKLNRNVCMRKLLYFPPWWFQSPPFRAAGWQKKFPVVGNWLVKQSVKSVDKIHIRRHLIIEGNCQEHKSKSWFKMKPTSPDSITKFIHKSLGALLLFLFFWCSEEHFLFY